MQRALALAESGAADAQLVARVRQLTSELDQEQRDGQLLAALDVAWLAEPSMSWERRFASEKSIPFLRDALTADGLAVAQDDPRTAAARIRGRQAKVQAEIVAALYEWYCVLAPPIGVSLKGGAQAGLVEHVSPEGPAARDGGLKDGDRIIGIGPGPGVSLTRSAALGSSAPIRRTARRAAHRSEERPSCRKRLIPVRRMVKTYLGSRHDSVWLLRGPAVC
jgi:hypothetical protein